MTRDKIKTLFDYLPLMILIIYTVILLWTIVTTNIVLQSEHYIGLLFLTLTIIMFVKRHKLGVLFTGLTLILGLFFILSYSGTITINSFGGSLNGHSLGDLKIQAIFLLWLVIHFIVSGRHYVGILTRKYWQDLLNKPQQKQHDGNHYRKQNIAKSEAEE